MGRYVRKNGDGSQNMVILPPGLSLGEVRSVGDEVFAGRSPLVGSALELARREYRMERLPDGESTIEHAERIASILLESGGSDISIGSALLHKMPHRLGRRPPKEVRGGFPIEDWVAVRYNVDRLEVVTRKPFLEMRGRFAIQNYMNMLINMCDNPDLIRLLSADKLGSIVTAMPADIDRMTEEMRYIYAPLSESIGLYEYADSFRDQILRLKNPEEYARTMEDLVRLLSKQFGLDKAEGEQPQQYQARVISHAEGFLGLVAEQLGSALSREGVDAVVTARVKTPDSIDKKIRYTDYASVERLPDVCGVEAVYNNPADGDNVMAAIHDIAEVIDVEYKGKFGDPKTYGAEAFHLDTFVGDVQVEFQVLDRANYELRETLRSHWQKTMMKRETPGQDFDKVDWVLTGDFARDYARIRSALLEHVFMLYLQEREGRYIMWPMRLKRGAIPADLAVKDTVNRFGQGYHGFVRVDFRSAGEDPRGAPKTKVAEDYTIQDGDVMMLRDDSRYNPLENDNQVSLMISRCTDKRARHTLEGIIAERRIKRRR